VSRVTLTRSVRAANLGTIPPYMNPVKTLHFQASLRLLCCAAAVALAACDAAPLPDRTAEDLMTDPVMLDGVLMKCNGAKGTQRASTECKNARIAVERLAKLREKDETIKREAAFERNRERLRLQQEALQHQQEEAKRVDPYKLPLIPPVENAAPPPTASN
jgi:hypothetical protein